MKPVLYRYKDTESVVLAMDGYVPGDGWSPLFDEAAMKAATAAALELAAEVCDGINADYTARYVAAGATRPNNLDFLDGASDGAEECAAAIRALKEES